MIRVYKFNEVSWADNETETRLTTQLADAMLEVNRLTQELAAHRRKIEFVMEREDYVPVDFPDWSSLTDEQKTEAWNAYMVAISKNINIPF